MKNHEINYLIGRGILAIKSHSLSAEAAYKVFKFRKFINNAILSIGEAERGLLDEVGIKDVREFDTLRSNLVDPEEIKKMNEQMMSFIKLKGELMNDEQKYDGPKLTWEEWKTLQDENQEVEVDGKKIDVLSGSIELLLEGNLWE